jgi:hypothetical protein
LHKATQPVAEGPLLLPLLLQTFAIMGGLYAAVNCFMLRLRRKQDGEWGNAWPPPFPPPSCSCLVATV